MKYEVKDQACGLDMPSGLHGVRYDQHFVKAPLSLHPKKEHSAESKYEAHEAMNISMGCK